MDAVKFENRRDNGMKLHRMSEMEEKEKSESGVDEELVGSGEGWTMEEEEEKRSSSSSNNEPGIEYLEEIRGRIGGCDKEIPPIDDVCPICFDRFNIPCRSNCGHWFCASCIMLFWMSRSSIHPCKCPLCFSRIINLKPEASQLIQLADADEFDALRKVHRYNHLFSSGTLSTFHKIRAFPVFMKRVFQVLIDPDVLRCTYYILRLLGLFLAILYERWEFDFVPNGGLGIRRMFDVGATILVVTLFLVGTGYPWVLRHCAGNSPAGYTNTHTHSRGFNS